MNKPNQLDNPDLNSLREICQEYVDFIDNDDEYHEDNNYDHYIFEEAMTTIFGEDVWDFINNRRA